MLPTRTPELLKWLYPSLIWNKPSLKKSIYLTFDDGPHPDITPWVMDELDKYGYKATFFCIGDNVLKFPKIYEQIIERGHFTGNHTFNHLRGFESKNETYFNNILQCDEWVKSKFFRPPHGQLTYSQVKHIKKNYQIVMWTLLAEDWNHNLNVNLKLRKLLKLTKSGDIIVFHDSVKAESNLKFLLPKYLQFLKDNQFEPQLF
jgi:peptidoglycan/xylan/chitin deacetylase (PgdA/CDA1 family)